MLPIRCCVLTDNVNLLHTTPALLGTAAVIVGGLTLHSLTGVGVPKEAKDFDRMWGTKYREKWRKMQVLIIDEISMISGSFLDYVDRTVRNIRQNHKQAFGGIQLIVCGDFGQLGPICDVPGSRSEFSKQPFYNLGYSCTKPFSTSRLSHPPPKPLQRSQARQGLGSRTSYILFRRHS